MGVPPEKQGKLYQFQINSLLNEYSEKRKFQAMIGGAKLK